MKNLIARVKRLESADEESAKSTRRLQDFSHLTDSQLAAGIKIMSAILHRVATADSEGSQDMRALAKEGLQLADQKPS